ncbi:MAG: Ig-like domain-containing protein [Eubacterium sp.]|nr:Ig-like domain-containing protein [Eubacterium sp.]
MKNIVRLIMMCIAVFVVSISIGTKVNAAEDPNPDSIDLYYLQDFYNEPLAGYGPSEILIQIPEALLKEYRISTKGFSGTPKYEIIDEDVAFEVTSDGTIKPTKLNFYDLISNGKASDLDNFMMGYGIDRDEKLFYAEGNGKVEVTCGDYHKIIKVNVKNYAEKYSDELIERIAGEVTQGKSTEYEKIQAITAWVGKNTAYHTAYSLCHNMMLMREGDCISNSIVIVKMARSVGIQARLRQANQDREDIGTGHVNAFVKCDGNYYIAEVYSVKEKNRPTEIRPQATDFSTLENSDGSLMIYQYNGFGEEAVIPAKINGKDVTTIGKEDRFDKDKIMPIFFEKYDFDTYVKKLIIPASVTKINDLSLGGSPKLSEIVVDSANPNYSSYDGALYNKDKTELLYVPAEKEFIILPASIKRINSTAFNDIKEIDVFFDGSESQWNSLNITLPDKASLYFGTTRVTGLKLNKPNLQFTSPGIVYNMDDLKCVSIVPADAANQKIKYITSDDDVVTVYKGKLYVNGEGECTITATSSDGGFSQKINVSVAFTGQKIKLDNGTIAKVVYEGTEYPEFKGLSEATVKPNSEVTVTRNEPDAGCEFTGWDRSPSSLRPTDGTSTDDYWELNYYKTEISFIMPSEDINLKANYKINQQLTGIDYIYPTDMEDDTGHSSYLYICEDSTLQLAIKAASDFQYTKNVSWESGNDSVVTIDSKGKVTAVGIGTTTITVKSNDNPNVMKTRYINVSLHDFDEDYVVIQRGDCLSQPKILERHCTRCNKVVRDIIPATGHMSNVADEGTPVEGHEPTCTSPGLMEYTCIECGLKYQEEVMALGHKMGEWEITKYAHYDDEKNIVPGEKKRCCSRCDHVEYDETYEFDPEDPDKPDNPIDPDDPVDPVDPVDPDKPITPDKPDVTPDEGKKDSTPKPAAKLKNTMTVKAKTVNVKKAKVKKKNVSVKASKAFNIKNAVGKLTYKKVKGNKKITVNAKTGKITIKKGLKKGVYTVKIKVTAAGNDKYNSISKTISVKIKVK